MKKRKPDPRAAQLRKLKRLQGKVRKFYQMLLSRRGMWETFQSEVERRIPERTILADGIKSRIEEVKDATNSYRNVFGDDVYKPLPKRRKAQKRS